MLSYIKSLERSLTDDQRDILKRIYEPTVVATPLSDSRRDICVLPNGEIRAYGKLYVDKQFAQGGQTAYLASNDCGLSWNINYSRGKMNSCTYIEKGKIYVTVCEGHHNNDGITQGLYVYRSKIGPDDENPEIIKLSDDNVLDSFLPLQSFYSNRIWFTAQQNGNPLFFFSDDFGKTWEKREIVCPNNFEITFPNKGLRWCKGSGTEPNVIEISENNLMMILRTPLDCFYISLSTDGGNSWSAPEATTFYGTNTTAFLLKLTDGRIINFWNNTKPLSQPNFNALPDTQEFVKTGHGENAFTNRDAAHAAISEDGGKTYMGYREIFLNPVRNNADFRYVCGTKYSADKSVHQFQAFELPYNKVLVSVGQNKSSRRLIIFDIDWLYETESQENFINGITNITAHTYIKSVSGCHYKEVGNGHCAWNRTYSAYPMPDPDGSNYEVLHISKHHDSRLYNDIGGICYNFPMSTKGKVSIEIKISEKQARFILSDRWYNTCDPFAAYYSPFWFELDNMDTGSNFVTVDIEYNTTIKKALVYIDKKHIFNVNLTSDCSTGISYLILQCATDGDSNGFFVKSIRKTDI